MPLSAGEKLGPYEIVAPLGAGGMGEVYRAHDTRLNRDVALKILPQDLANDPSRRARFEQEARAVAALNHPNIVAVYDVGDGYIVSELVEGEPLRAGKLGIRKTIDVAAQIASGLAAAHDAGIVHRDLKPDNILLTRDGRPKILDFGLAKVQAPHATPADETVTVRTEAGLVMGTPGYMSPEQVRGHATDHRSDIFSFGVILYELLSGKRVFRGETSVDTMQAILRQEAPELPETVPAGLRQIVAHSLEKAPEDRFQSARDLSFSLAALAQSGSHASLAPVRSARHRWLLGPVVAALITAVVATAASWRYWRPAPPPPFDVLTRVTTDPGLTTDPTLSPDGKMIAYASDRGGDGGLDIWVQQLAGGEAVRLTNDPSDDRQPRFSPDGSTIVFRSERDHGGLYTVPSLGGAARLLVPEGFDPEYSPDGQSIAYWTGYTATAFAARSWIYSINERTQQQIRPDFARVTRPIWSPDGKSLMFVGSPKLEQVNVPQSFDWWITPVTGGNAVQTGALAYLREQRLAGARPTAWLPSNEILFSASAGDATNIWRIPVSRDRRLESRPVRVTMGTQQEAHPFATRDNLVAYAGENSANEIWSVDLNPDVAGAHHDVVRLVGSAGTNIRPSISRDGNTMAYISNSKSGPHVWIKSLTRGSDRALTGGSKPEYWPVLSPDGTKVAFTTVAQYPTEAQLRAGVPLLIAEVRTGAPKEVCPNCNRPEDWSADSHKILLGLAKEIVEFDLSATKRTTLINGRDVNSPRYSPDGRWVSFHERTSPDTRQLWIAPLDGGVMPVPPERWIAISDNTTVDREVRWSADGSWLYFASNRDGFHCIWAQRLDPSSKRPAGPPVPIHHFHSVLLGLTLADSGFFGMSVGAGRMVVSLGATTGNVWLLRRP